MPKIALACAHGLVTTRGQSSLISAQLAYVITVQRSDNGLSQSERREVYTKEHNPEMRTALRLSLLVVASAMSCTHRRACASLHCVRTASIDGVYAASLQVSSPLSPCPSPMRQ